MVGAPGAPLTGFYKEAPAVYPFINSSTGLSNAAGLDYPLDPRLQPLFESQPRQVPERSGAGAVWTVRQQRNVSVQFARYVYCVITIDNEIRWTGRWT
jgi:hypothetical protein